MDTILRAVAVYVIILVLMRISGKRTFADITAFDFVLILIIAETTQQALLGDDFSITNSALLITALLALDIGFSYMKKKVPFLARWLDGMPVLLVQDGVVMHDRLSWARVEESDIVESARKNHGLERMDQIKHAVLEQSGSISIIPK